MFSLIITIIMIIIGLFATLFAILYTQGAIQAYREFELLSVIPDTKEEWIVYVIAGGSLLTVLGMIYATGV